jgi:hypothetical protein
VLRRIMPPWRWERVKGVEALRSAGVGVELEDYTVEVMVDSTDPVPAASVRLVFGSAPA